MQTIDINIINLAIGFSLLIVPVIILIYYKTALTSSMLLSIFRMILQLSFIGIYLKYIFELNAVWVNLTWAMLMVLITAVTIVKRSELSLKIFLAPIFAGVSIGMLFSSLFLLKFVLRLDNIYEARYLIPILGMIAGNCLNAAIVGLRHFYAGIQKDEERYKYYLSCGAKPSEALLGFIKNSMKEAFQPAIAQTATIGLIALPGMMTGQILGGSSPLLAIKYQIMIMTAIMDMTAFEEKPANN